MKEVIKFSAEWCGPCKTMQPIFEKISKELASDELVFKEIDVENDEEGYTEDFGIRNIPTFLISNEHGEELGRLVGSKPEEELRKFILENTENKVEE